MDIKVTQKIYDTQTIMGLLSEIRRMGSTSGSRLFAFVFMS